MKKSKTNEDILVEANREKTLYRCPECKEPLATKKGDSFFVMKRSHGEYIDVEIDIQNSAETPVRLACGRCRRTSAIFVTVRAKSPMRKMRP